MDKKLDMKMEYAIAIIILALLSAQTAAAQSKPDEIPLESAASQLTAKLTEVNKLNAVLDQLESSAKVRQDELLTQVRALNSELKASCHNNDALQQASQVSKADGPPVSDDFAQVEQQRQADLPGHAERAPAPTTQTDAQASTQASRDANAMAETEPAKRESTELSSAQVATPKDASMVTTKPTPTTASDAYIPLGGDWGVTYTDAGPIGYMTIEQARSVQANLPIQSDCKLFAQGFIVDKNITKKLEVNGFPVMAFWVVKPSGKLAICRVASSPSGEYTASVTRQRPSRSEKAFAAVLSGQ